MASLRDAVTGPITPPELASAAPWLPSWLPRPLATVVRATMVRVQRLLGWWQASRLGRANSQYNTYNGGLQSGGLAYTALFSIFAALTVAYTAMVSVLGGSDRLQDLLFTSVNEFVPGLIDLGDGGVIRPEQLLLSNARTITGIVAGVVLLWSAISFMDSLRSAARTMLGLATASQNFLLVKIYDLVGFILLGVALLISAAGTAVGTRLGQWLSGLLGDSVVLDVLVPAVGTALAFAVDVAVVVYVVWVLAGARPRWRDLLIGAAAAAVVFAGLRYVGVSVVTRSAQSNALLASFAVVASLLLVVNFVTQILLRTCAWIADIAVPGVPGPVADPGTATPTVGRWRSASEDVAGPVVKTP